VAQKGTVVTSCWWDGFAPGQGGKS
jgi:hypothetical protein